MGIKAALFFDKKLIANYLAYSSFIIYNSSLHKISFKKMKYSKYIVALFSLVVVLFGSACKESLLDVSPAGNNTSNDFYKDESQLNQGVLAIYNSLRTMPTNNWLMSEVRADNGLESFVNVQRDVNDIGNFLAASQTGAIQTTWSTLYNQIYRANIVLEK